MLYSPTYAAPQLLQKLTPLFICSLIAATTNSCLRIFQSTDLTAADHAKTKETYQGATPENRKLHFSFPPPPFLVKIQHSVQPFSFSPKLGFVATSISSGVTFLPKLFLKVFAPIFVHLIFINKFYIAALNFPKSFQLFWYNLFMPKFRMSILNFLTICIKLRPKNSIKSVLKLLATHRLKTSKCSYHSRKFTTFRFIH